MADVLDEVLREAQDLGFFGPGPLDEQRRHAERLCRLAVRGLERAAPLRFLDLGSGGGLPGLVLVRGLDGAVQCSGTLLDSRPRRTAFLAEAVARLEASERIEVITARAEDAARDTRHRERYDLVVARGFGRPAVTAECAVAFLRPGGRLVVSEPPTPDPTRWSEAALAKLGLAGPQIVVFEDTHAAILHRAAAPLSPRWPRKRGIPAKRPLW